MLCVLLSSLEFILTSNKWGQARGKIVYEIFDIFCDFLIFLVIFNFFRKKVYEIFSSTLTLGGRRFQISDFRIFCQHLIGRFHYLAICCYGLNTTTVMLWNY